MSKSRYDGTVRTPQGEALSGVDVYVCTEPNSISPTAPAIPPSPLASLWSDQAGTVPIVQPVESDGNGNFFFYTDPGTYTFVFHDPLGRIPDSVFPNQTVATPGGGSVSSIGVTVPDGFQVSPSAITSTGVFVISYTSDWTAHTFLAGPTSGGASTPTRRAIVSSDLPGGTGTVSSVALTVGTDDNVDAVVSGSPVTGAGTLHIDLSLDNQDANTVLAGPTSGGTGPVTARALVPEDIPGIGLASAAFSIQQSPPATAQTIGAGMTGVALQDLTFDIPAGTWNILLFGSAQFDNSATDIDVNIEVQNLPSVKGSAHGTTPSAGTGQAIALSFCGLDLAVAGGVSKTYHLLGANNGASSVDVTWATLTVLLVPA